MFLSFVLFAVYYFTLFLVLRCSYFYCCLQFCSGCLQVRLRQIFTLLLFCCSVILFVVLRFSYSYCCCCCCCPGVNRKTRGRNSQNAATIRRITRHQSRPSAVFRVCVKTARSRSARKYWLNSRIYPELCTFERRWRWLFGSNGQVDSIRAIQSSTINLKSDVMKRLDIYL